MAYFLILLTINKVHLDRTQSNEGRIVANTRKRSRINCVQIHGVGGLSGDDGERLTPT